MSLKIYLDDCAFSRRLRDLLKKAGHTVKVPADVVPPLTGADDGVHFTYAQVTGYTLLTFNPRDFKALHDADPHHSGILAVYQDNDPTRDMSYRDIVQAIDNLEHNVDKIAGGFWSLNACRW